MRPFTPDDAEAWTCLGRILGRLGREEKSIEAFDVTIRLDPGSYDAHRGRGISLFGLGFLIYYLAWDGFDAPPRQQPAGSPRDSWRRREPTARPTPSSRRARARDRWRAIRAAPDSTPGRSRRRRRHKSGFEPLTLGRNSTVPSYPRPARRRIRPVDCRWYGSHVSVARGHRQLRRQSS